MATWCHDYLIQILNPFCQGFGVDGMEEGHVTSDGALTHETLQLGIHRDHGFVAAAEDDVVNLVGTTVTDHILDGGVDRHELEDGDTAAVFCGDETLRDHCPEHHGELDTNLGLLLGREGVHNAVDRFGRPDGMQGGKEEMTGLGGCDGDANGVKIAHFAE